MLSDRPCPTNSVTVSLRYLPSPMRNSFSNIFIRVFKNEENLWSTAFYLWPRWKRQHSREKPTSYRIGELNFLIQQRKRSFAEPYERHRQKLTVFHGVTTSRDLLCSMPQKTKSYEIEEEFLFESCRTAALVSSIHREDYARDSDSVKRIMFPRFSYYYFKFTGAKWHSIGMFYRYHTSTVAVILSEIVAKRMLERRR